jgi:ubiquitin-conjugating enzyme E2 N
MSQGDSMNLRTLKELKWLMAQEMPGITCVQNSTNHRYLLAHIVGPDNTPYEGGVFTLELFVPYVFPFQSPKVRFKTKIYHPNIDYLGRIDLFSLREESWSP